LTFDDQFSQPRGVVTPEAVVLEFDTAGVGSRGVGFIIDLLLQLVVLGVVLIALAIVVGAASGGETLAIVVAIISALLIVIGYPAVMETFWGGRTLGNAALGLRAVTLEGAPTRFRHAIIRSIFRAIEGIVLLGGPAVLAMTFTSRDQRFGDLVAGTIVVRERSASKHAYAVRFPPPYGYESYVGSLDVGRLTEEQYALIRSYLLRSNELTPAARTAIAVRLANPVASTLSHTPPPMVSPDMFLACVAAAYQSRGGGMDQLLPPPPLPPPVAPAPPAPPPPGTGMRYPAPPWPASS
jgi:uncharacterized RDD family membrane protein YckC